MHSFVMLCRVMLIMPLILAAAVSADVPGSLIYQGRLLDGHGQPVTDTVNLTFQIYPDSTGGTVLWKEDHADVPVTDGLFTVRLGLINGFGTTFDGSTKWLTIDYMGSSSDPRIPIDMVPYAQRSTHSDTAQFAHAGVEGNFVEVSGDTMSGSLVFDVHSNGSTEASLEAGDEWVNLSLYDSGELTSKLWGDLYGQLDLYHTNNDLRRILMAASSRGGRLVLNDSSGASRITLNSRSDYADDAVELPDDAINSREMLNEPGIAGNFEWADVTLDQDSAFVTVASVSITIPEPGYIHVIGKCDVTMESWSSGPEVWIQVRPDPDYGGGYHVSGVRVKILEGNQAAKTIIPATAQFIWYMDTAGTYEFHLQGRRRYNSADSVRLDRSYITAIYYPTSYGSVNVLSTDPNEYPDARPVHITGGRDEPALTVYETDLRELELRVERERRQALEAELELERARANQHNQQR